MERNGDETLEIRIAALTEALQRLEGQSVFLRELSMDERCALPKLDDDRERFTREALRTAKARPELLPPHSDPHTLERGLEVRSRLKEAFERSNKVTERLDDTIVQNGAEAYITALSFFRALEVEAEEDPESARTYDYLRRLFQPWEEVGR